MDKQTVTVHRKAQPPAKIELSVNKALPTVANQVWPQPLRVLSDPPLSTNSLLDLSTIDKGGVPVAGTGY